MTEANMDALKTFFTEKKIHNPLCMMIVLRPFFDKIINDVDNRDFTSPPINPWDQYKLSKKIENWNEIKCSIENITGKTVKGLNFISTHTHLERNEYLTDAVHDKAVNKYLKEIKNDLCTYYGATLNESSIKNLKKKVGNSAWNEISKNLNFFLLDSLYKSYRNYLWPDVWINHWANIFYYVCYCYIDDRERRDMFKTHLELLYNLIFLGETNNESNLWPILRY